MFPHVLGWDDLPHLYWADLASLASDSFVFSRPLLQVQDLPNFVFVFVFVPILYFCIFLALCCSATGAEHSKWRQQSTTNRKYFGLNFLTWSAPRLSVIISSTVLWPSSLSLISLCAPLTQSPQKQRCLLSSPYSQLLHKNGKNIALFFLQEITVSGPDGTQEKIEVPIWNGTAANIILMSLGPRCFFCCICLLCIVLCIFSCV